MSRRVVVVPHDPAWSTGFATAYTGVAPALGANLVALHHIGSTAIPGIYAKPIIDILAVVTNIELVDQSNAELERLHYHARGEFGIPGRRYFYRNDAAGVRTHQIHAFQVGSLGVIRHLAFRDFLRAHTDIALSYSLLKQRLAAAHPEDIEAYMDGKDPFIKDVEAKALAWATGRTGTSTC